MVVPKVVSSFTKTLINEVWQPKKAVNNIIEAAEGFVEYEEGAAHSWSTSLGVWLLKDLDHPMTSCKITDDVIMYCKMDEAIRETKCMQNKRIIIHCVGCQGYISDGIHNVIEADVISISHLLYLCFSCCQPEQLSSHQFPNKWQSRACLCNILWLRHLINHGCGLQISLSKQLFYSHSVSGFNFRISAHCVQK